MFKKKKFHYITKEEYDEAKMDYREKRFNKTAEEICQGINNILKTGDYTYYALMSTFHNSYYLYHNDVSDALEYVKNRLNKIFPFLTFSTKESYYWEDCKIYWTEKEEEN